MGSMIWLNNTLLSEYVVITTVNNKNDAGRRYLISAGDDRL